MDINSRALAHWKKRCEEYGLREIRVPEWSDPETEEPAILYYRPANVATRDRILEACDGGRERGYCVAMVTRCLRADGAPIWLYPTDVETLAMKVDPMIVKRVGEVLLGDMINGGTDAAKKD